jgi:hypothetical protein
MQTDRADRDCPRSALKAGFANMLEIGSNRPLLRSLPGVLRFDDILGLVVIEPAITNIEPAITNNETGAAFGEESPLVARYLIAHPGGADLVPLPLPQFPVDRDSATQRVDLDERP